MRPASRLARLPEQQRGVPGAWLAETIAQLAWPTLHFVWLRPPAPHPSPNLTIPPPQTNCLAPLAKVVDDAFGIKEGLMTTVRPLRCAALCCAALRCTVPRAALMVACWGQPWAPLSTARRTGASAPPLALPCRLAAPRHALTHWAAALPSHPTARCTPPPPPRRPWTAPPRRTGAAAAVSDEHQPVAAAPGLLYCVWVSSR